MTSSFAFSSSLPLGWTPSVYVSLFSLLPKYLPQTRTSFLLSWVPSWGKGHCQRGTWVAGRNLVLHAGQVGALRIFHGVLWVPLAPGFCGFEWWEERRWRTFWAWILSRYGPSLDVVPSTYSWLWALDAAVGALCLWGQWLPILAHPGMFVGIDVLGTYDIIWWDLT